MTMVTRSGAGHKIACCTFCNQACTSFLLLETGVPNTKNPRFLWAACCYSVEKEKHIVLAEKPQERWTKKRWGKFF